MYTIARRSKIQLFARSIISNETIDSLSVAREIIEEVNNFI